ncbi:DExH-box ATP-dependent RNA helicase DExH18, mitochondrial-like protein [Tanacetum coccineum]
MSDLYDIKISVRSSVKLLPEIKGLLSIKPNHERSFRDIVFESWLDIQSHKNDTHMMHYVKNIRAIKRKIVYHCGPTNSGKTYNALQRFMEEKKGIYCSPLRLLAMEVFDKVNSVGVYCSLLMGQEKKYVPFGNHTACTVEMVSTDELYEVVVIDEIQMMSDLYRGYAWTRALLGLQADEIHLCGDPSVLGIVRKICQETGDELIENHYERFKPLVVEAKTLLGDIRNVRSGDCVVAFSRREIFEVKLAIEKHTSHKCCVIYGALPPETCRHQANLFNDTSVRVMIFGCRVMHGYNGDKIVPVAASQVKQIAGRAGRRGSIYPDGLTTTLHLDDLDYLIECLQKPFDEVTKVGLFPFFEQVELFAGQLADITFSQLLQKFGENCRLDGSYFLCKHDHIKKVANMLGKVQGLSLEDRFNFCFAPVNIRDPKAMFHLLRFAQSYSQNVPVSLAMGMPTCSARNDTELLDLETKHQVLSMYLWLSNHFKEETFPYVKKAEAMATDIAELLGQSLIKANWKPESRNQGKKHNDKDDGYERPRSMVKLQDKKRQEKDSQSVEKVAACPTNLIAVDETILEYNDHFRDATSHKGCQIRRESAHGETVCCNNVRALFDELPTLHLIVEITPFPTSPLTESDYARAEKLEKVLRSGSSI